MSWLLDHYNSRIVGLEKAGVHVDPYLIRARDHIAELEDKLRRVNQIAWEALGTEIDNRKVWGKAMVNIEALTRPAKAQQEPRDE